MYIVMNALGEAEEISDDYKDVLSNYCQTLLELGFTYKYSMARQEGDYQQDILLFFTQDDAERALLKLPQMAMDLFLALYEELGAEIESESSDIDTSELGPDSHGISVTLREGQEKIRICIVASREKNVISIISIASLPSSPYFDNATEDAISLSKQALEKIRTQMGGKEPLSPVPESTYIPELMKLIPAALIDGKDNYMVINDYAMIRELFDATIPDTSTDKDIEEYLKSMYGFGDDLDYMSGMATGSFISGHDMYSTSTPIRMENVGYNLFNVHADIYTDYTANYTNYNAAIIGRFDPIVTQEAMSNQSKWPEAVRDNFILEDYRDTKIYSWSDYDYGKENWMKPPILNRIGQALPFAVTPTNVFYAETLGSVKMMIDASEGNTTSLADVDEYYTAAKGLVELGAYSCIIGSESIVNSEDFQRDESETLLLKPYLTFGTGIGRDILGPYMALVLVHDNATAAATNAEILVERVNNTTWMRPVDWLDAWRLYVDYIQVNAEGNVILAKLYGDRAQYIWERWIYECNPFLLHE